MKIKREKPANISIPGDALLKLPIGKFVACQYSLVDGRSTPTIIWTYADERKCLRSACFDFYGDYLGELENEQ